MARLKPCMKCPSDRVAFDRDVDADGFGRYLFVKCLDCGVRSRPKFVVQEEPQDYQEVADDWNDRPLEQVSAGGIPADYVRKGKFDSTVAHFARMESLLKDEITRLIDDLDTARAYRDPEGNTPVWHWQGDQYDRLETLTGQVVVVIRAGQLRSLLETKGSTGGEVSQ